ncbi:DUF6503 family protein [Algoriphagus sp.]|uniref:DUF6503 family protein n=1 Tax=Algoriphagus sp. TaxID=1872435 RepID=UPI0025F5DF54|nr:DUF6503 family protein [Algoriphagus sp.]
MKSSYSILILFSILLFSSCSESSVKEIPEVSPEYKELLDAHGDWSKWIRAKAMSYSMIHETNLTQENYFVNLDSRKIRLDASNFSIGKDEEGTWVSPSRDAFGGTSIDFYHNLYFYFYSIPYVFTDPGITVSQVENKMLNGVSYKTLQATMSPENGKSPDDQYFMLLNPETGRLEYLLYTVTYFGNSSPSFSALKYDDYRNADGLFFPRILTGYNFENDSTKGIKYQVSFADILLLDEPFDDSIFEKPDSGVYAN